MPCSPILPMYFVGGSVRSVKSSSSTSWQSSASRRNSSECHNIVSIFPEPDHDHEWPDDSRDQTVIDAQHQDWICGSWWPYVEPGRGFWEGGLAGQGAPGFHFRAWPHGSRRLTREGGGAQVHQEVHHQQHHRSKWPTKIRQSFVVNREASGNKRLGGRGLCWSRLWDAEGWAGVKEVTSTRPGKSDRIVIMWCHISFEKETWNLLEKWSWRITRSNDLNEIAAAVLVNLKAGPTVWLKA